MMASRKNRMSVAPPKSLTNIPRYSIQSEMQTFCHLGRSISRIVILFDTADNLVKESDRRELDSDEDDAEQQPAPDEE